MSARNGCGRTSVLLAAIARRLRNGTLTSALAAAAVGLAGCTQPDVKPQAATPPVNLSGYSAGFKEGFKDGCDSARGRVRRDDKRAGADSQYAQGWQDGRAICSKR
jgi:hypothetical protein